MKYIYYIIYIKGSELYLFIMYICIIYVYIYIYVKHMKKQQTPLFSIIKDPEAKVLIYTIKESCFETIN